MASTTPQPLPKPTPESQWAQAPIWPRKPEMYCYCARSPLPSLTPSAWPVTRCASCARTYSGPWATTCLAFPSPPACFIRPSTCCLLRGWPLPQWLSAPSASLPTASVCAIGSPVELRSISYGPLGTIDWKRSRPVRILTRYILGEILSHTLIGCALFTFILFMQNLPHILETIVRNSSTFTDVMEVLLFTLPNTFKVTIPMAVLVGVLLGLSRLAADSEITAMRASGLGIGYFVRVASIVAVAGTLLGLANSIYIAPRANQAILAMQQELATSQASYEIQRGVFYEDFKNYVLYVQDVRAGTGASNWRQVFMADVSDPATPIVTTAASATVVNDESQELLMRLRNGAEHQMIAGEPQQYNISAFASTDRPLVLSRQGDVHLGRMDTAIYAMPLD